MKKILLFSFLTLTILNPGQVKAQLIVTTIGGSMTPLQLVQNYFVGNGITLSNVTYNGLGGLIYDDNPAYFTAAGGAFTELGLSSGILMSTGCAEWDGAANISCEMTCGSLLGGDPDLTIIAGMPTFDERVLEFDFVPQGDTIKCRYVFGSDEFFYRCNVANDPVGFFLSGPGINGPFSNNSVDIALLPGSSNYVTTDNICGDSTVCWCNAPVYCPPDPNNPNPVPSYGNCANPRGHGMFIEFNGFTYVLTAWYIVTPCSTYHIKLATADGYDNEWDSGLFLEKNSFSSNGLDVHNTYTHPDLAQGAIEGCSDAIVSFHLPVPVAVPYVIHYSISGTAIMGTDYTPIPDSVVIPTGQNSASVAIHPFMDNIPEGIESVILGVNTSPCGVSILNDTIRIYDNTTLIVSAGNDTSFCLGNSITLHASPTGGQAPYHYEWSTGPKLQNITITPPSGVNIYSVTLTDACGATSVDSVIITAYPPPLVTNNPLSKSICSGESTNIPLTSNVPGTAFHWTASLTSGNITGFSPDSGLVLNQVLVNPLSTPGIVTYHITPKIGNCTGIAVDFTVTVNAGDSVKVSISASNNNVCAGKPVTFTATPTNGGITPAYQWKINGISVGANNPVYTCTPLNGDVVYCILTSSNIVCTSNNPATSNQVIMIVNTNLPVNVSISASANPVCAGTSVTFLANPANPGTSPVYQWKVNGIMVGTNSPSYSYIPINGDHVICVLTSDETCTFNNPATSNQVIMIINSNMVVGVSIIASLNPVCSGNPVTFIASPSNGGSSPVYQWKVNGNNTGTNSSTYIYNPLSGDQVSCILTSNIVCPVGNPATSNIITMNVAASPVVTFTRCNDSVTTTNAKPFILKGGIPLGGIYSGAGVSGGIFHPAIAGTGTHQITYTYTNAALCSANAIVTIVTIVTLVTNCGQPITDLRDNKVYMTVQIGVQCWMAENLNYGYAIDEYTNQRDNCIPEKYHNPASSIEHPASVYQWDELMQYDETISNQGLCPPAWHVPSEADWHILFANYVNNGFSASPLKYSGFSGFNALLSGVGHMNITLDYQGFGIFFWSSTAHGTLKAWSHGMNDTDPSVSFYPAFRNNAFSIRCIRDN